MTGDRDPYRAATAAAVLLVAAIAATVSYVHIESLAMGYGQPRLAAWLLPLSIDGTVATSSLAMLRAARSGLSAPWLARGMLLLAVAATLACNVGYGLPHGWPGAPLGDHENTRAFHSGRWVLKPAVDTSPGTEDPR